MRSDNEKKETEEMKPQLIKSISAEFGLSIQRIGAIGFWDALEEDLQKYDELGIEVIVVDKDDEQ